jgi:hypothetical protein
MNTEINPDMSRLKSKEKSKLADTELAFYRSMFSNLPYYIFLIDTDVRVLYTNYFDLNTDAEPIEPMVLGNVLKCNNAVESGCCGTHNMCKFCMIRASIVKSFTSGTPIVDTEAHLRLYNKMDVAVDTDVSVAGKVIMVKGKKYMTICVRDITTLKALQRRFLKNEYRLNLALRETEVYMNLIRSVTSSFDGKLAAMKEMSKQEEDKYSSLELVEKYTSPIVSSLPSVLLFCKDDVEFNLLNAMIGKVYNLIRSSSFDETLMSFLNTKIEAVLIGGSIKMNEANMLSDVVHCSAGTHPVFRFVRHGESIAGSYDAVMEEPFEQEELERKLAEFII